jgi:putative heme-binding domain-containing protein
MFRQSLPVSLVLFLVAGALSWPSPAVAQEKPGGRSTETWADPGLNVINGLTLWLDATRLNVARQAVGRMPLQGGALVDIWYDGSGHGLHLSQSDASAQPTFQDTNGFRTIRFDGEKAYLARGQTQKSFRDVTIFLVVTPFANPGHFRAFVALNETGKNDYVTGLTLDQGPQATSRFQSLNPEGAGFIGAVNLMHEEHEFGTVQRLCVTSTPGADGTRLYINGQFNGQRKRAPSVLRMDQVWVGVRYYTNGGPPPPRGFLDGDMAEVLVYDRVLTEAERTAVESYLAVKHGEKRKLTRAPKPVVGKPLIGVAKTPPVQMVVPGFTVKQLPVDLTNINNVQYRSDGKLVALAYNGNVYLLSDTDGDGLEDKVELFWENKGSLRAPIGMALTPPGYQHGNGVFVASKGKCSLLVDTKGTGKADKEIVIAQGWQEIPHGVDALGAAYDPRDGSIYFGLGCADYTNAYQVGQDGKARYRLSSERGTILRVTPDFKGREIIATGIRFPVGIRLNSEGDLFCTDQEGATWLPNGNPLDELLHIQKGRHYGFPPRHPLYLPKVIDEPSVFDYGPQHQSTCGLNFNEPVNGGPVVGPSWWQSDVFIAGYSRGKLYRTKLVKTPAGYVAQNQLLAALNMLACDVCVSPKGELVIAVHSGGPDWGSGPTGKGKLYKVCYTGKELPQPVLAWAQGPREVCIAFDRPIAPPFLKELASRVSIEYGQYVSPGDRFEHLRPGYQVVQDQLRAPRYELPVVGVQVTGDRRTLILATARQTEAVHYAVTLPGLGRPVKPNEQSRELPQVPETDLGYDLTGVEAVWQAKDGDARWNGWLPHLDLEVAQHLTQASAPHQELGEHWQKPGMLTLRTKLPVKDMLRPAVQPGSKIDYDWPAEQVTLIFRARQDLEVRTATGVVPTTLDPEGYRCATVAASPNTDVPVALDIRLITGDGEPDLRVTYRTNEDARPRALPLQRLLLPWATRTKQESPTLVDRDIPELQGGNWARGRQVFFSAQATCSKCHMVGGQGGAIGPDLSNLPHRDYASVLRDITTPSYAINPDYITQILLLKNGRVLTGSVRTEGEKLLVGDQQGQVTAISRADVEEMQSSPTSIMPEGLPQLLGPERMRDLLTFLLADPPRMPNYGKGAPPPPRPLNEVKAVLAGAPATLKTRPLHVVLVAGKKDHGPGEHDYPAWQQVWQKLLAMAADTKVTTANDWPSAQDLQTADVLVFYQHGQWAPERAKAIDAFLARGGGLVYIHFAVDGGKDSPGFAQRIGLAWQGGQSRFRHGPLDLGFRAGKNHPIARNFDKVHFDDESYWNLAGDINKVHLLATGVEEGKEQPLFWTLEPSKGRVFVSIPGHFAWTFDDPLFRILLLRGIAWVAREPVDRFNDLVTPGARIKEEKDAKEAK